MKTGVVLYIIGSEKTNDDFDFENAIEKLEIKADMIEVVSQKIGHFDVMDAWWLMLAKGMKRIVLSISEVNNSELNLLGKEIQLSG